MCRYCVPDKLDGMRKSAVITHCAASVVDASGISSDVVQIRTDVGDAYAVNAERCDAARGGCAGVYFYSLRGCLCLGVDCSPARSRAVDA